MDPLKPLGPAAPLQSRAEEVVQSYYEKLLPYQNIILSAVVAATLVLVLVFYMQQRDHERAERATYEAAKANTVAELEKVLKDYPDTSETPQLLFKLACRRYEDAKGDKAALDRIAIELEKLQTTYPASRCYVTRELVPSLLRTVNEDREFVTQELPGRLKELKDKAAASAPKEGGDNTPKKDGDGAAPPKDGTAPPPKDGDKKDGGKEGTKDGGKDGGKQDAPGGGNPPPKQDPPKSDQPGEPPKDGAKGAPKDPPAPPAEQPK